MLSSPLRVLLFSWVGVAWGAPSRLGGGGLWVASSWSGGAALGASGPRAFLGRVPCLGFSAWGGFLSSSPLGGALCGAPRVLAPLPGFGVAAGVGNDADDFFLQSPTGCCRFGSSFYFVKVFCSNSAFRLFVHPKVCRTARTRSDPGPAGSPI